jgi:hypothetical protein
MKCDSVLTITDGDITVTTSGGLYYNNGITENTNYTGNTDNVSSDYYSSPKGIKAGVKTQNGNSYTYSGGIVISGGNIKVTTSGTNAEGIESKNYLNIEGGEIYINAYDDGINSAQNLTVTDGFIYSRSTNNDGMDANGNLYLNGGLVYAIGARTPEVAIDANSEEGKKVYVNGGVIIAVGGIENGAAYNQPKIQQSSVSSNTWYTVTYGDNAVAFYTPTISTGGGPGGGGPGGPGGSNSSKLVISSPTTPTLSTGNSITDGIAHFEGNCYVSGNGNDSTGVNEFAMEEITIKNVNGTIVVEGCEECAVSIFNIEGRRVGNKGLATGVYLVKVGNYPTRKIVVTR